MKKFRVLLVILMILGVLFLGVGIRGVRDNLRPVLPYSTMTSEQVEKGMVICGYVGVNLGSFAEEYHTGHGSKMGDSLYYYVILAGDKVMALRCRGGDQKEILDAQAAQMTGSMQDWREAGKKNAAQAGRTLRVQGVVSEMNESVLTCMEEYLTPQGESGTVAEILPYVVDVSMLPLSVNVTYISIGILALASAIAVLFRGRFMLKQ